MPPTRPKRKPTAPTSRQVISRALREIIASRSPSTYALAERVGVNRSVLGRFLNGTRDLKVDTLDRLADVLKLRLVEVGESRGRPSKGKPARALPGAVLEVDDSDSTEPHEAKSEGAGGIDAEQAEG